MKEQVRRSKDLTLEFIETREMTEPEVGAVVQMYFTWWKRRYERRLAEEVEKRIPTEPVLVMDWVI